jgi:ABC-type multidrug transport system permease subunit
MSLFKNMDVDLILSWVFAIIIGIGLQYLLIFILPSNSPQIWIKWMAIPVAYGAQKLIYKEFKNPSKFEGQE